MKLVALDIETITLDADEYVQSELIKQAHNLRNKAQIDFDKIENQYKRDDTIKKHCDAVREKLEKDLKALPEKIEKSLIGNRGMTQIVCISLAHRVNSDVKHHFFNGPNEQFVIGEFISFLNAAKFGEFKFVTYNGDSFDLPQILISVSRYHYAMKNPFDARQFVDLIKYPFERFTKNLKLDDLAELYGVKEPVGTLYDVPDFEGVDLDGSYVAEMHKLDRLDDEQRVVGYCNRDTYKTLSIAEKIGQFVKVG